MTSDAKDVSIWWRHHGTAFVTVTYGLDPGSGESAKAGIWLGGTDEAKEGDWLWMPSGRQVLYYSAWANGQPDNYAGNENCLIYMHNTRAWDDLDCDNEQVYRWICEG